MSGSLQDTLADALAPDENGPHFITWDASCTHVGCDRPATTFVPVSPNQSGLDEDTAPRCTDHSDQRFRVDNDGKANWAAHKLRAARHELADVDTLYQAELDRLNAWRDAQSARAKRSVEFFEHHLVLYGLALRATDPEGKERASHALPGGTIRFRRSQSVQIDDEDALVAWVEVDHADLLRKSVAVTAIKDLLQKDTDKQLQPVTADGEVVPGIRIERRLTPSVETT